MTTVSEAIKKRHSARAFLDKDVDIEIVKNIIEIAKQSPSGVNTQPWNIYVLSGDARNKLVHEATSRYDQGKMDGQEYLVYPKEMPDWYKERENEKEELNEDELEERCQKGYKTHPTRKTKKMYGKTYRNCIKAE